MQWQPIETAPKNEVDVLLCFADSLSRRPPLVAGFYHGEWMEFDHVDGIREKPTHWMPLPPDPNT